MHPLEHAHPDDGIRLVLNLPPLGNRFYRRFRNRIVMSEEGREYKEYVSEVTAGKYDPFTQPVRVFLDVYRARRAGDLDGFLKCLLDSLQGVVYANDKQIVEIHARRFDDRDNPRVELTVVEAPEQPEPPKRARRKQARAA